MNEFCRNIVKKVATFVLSLERGTEFLQAEINTTDIPDNSEYILRSDCEKPCLNGVEFNLKAQRVPLRRLKVELSFLNS